MLKSLFERDSGRGNPSMKPTARAHIEAKERLIFALDVSDEDEAKRLVELLGDQISFFKVGLELFTATGFKVVDWLLGRNKQVFLDIKWLDIPETVGAVVRLVSGRGVHFATVDGNGGSEMMRAAAANRSGDLRLLCLTVLTSLNNHVLREMGKDFTVEGLVELRTKDAIQSGMDGVITSGREVSLVRKIADSQQKEDFLIVTPGMRLPGTSRDDHRRAQDPESAVRDGADYIVVGRPIRCATNPKEEARRFIEAIDRGLSSRSVAV